MENPVIVSQDNCFENTNLQQQRLPKQGKLKTIILGACMLGAIPAALGQPGFTTVGTNTTTNDNVGIGLTSPTSKLHILSGYSLSGGSMSPCTYVGQPAISIHWNSPDPTLNPMCSGYNNAPFNILEVLDYPAGASWVNPFLILNRLGQLGVRMNPSNTANLSVSGNSYFQGNSQVTGKLSVGNTTALTSSAWSSTSYILSVSNGNSFFDGDATITGSSSVGGSSTVSGNAVVNGTMHIGGKVRIGADEPDGSYSPYQLGVDGMIVCKHLVVQTGSWSDYVFDDNYKLPTLDFVASYIAKEKHLPGIPSEAEVKAQGINVGEMNELLLKKIEELTLYAIELKKRVDILEKRAKK